MKMTPMQSLQIKIKCAENLIAQQARHDDSSDVFYLSKLFMVVENEYPTFGKRGFRACGPQDKVRCKVY
jgi:hypothetical protein